jgi:DNA-3-methyladenine glycosylase
MFGPPGHLYVYFTYGMHWAANISCGPEGTARGVLLRAGEVIAGAEIAQSRRGRSTVRDLARGPGRLTQALGIDGSLAGADVLDGDEVSLRPGPRPETVQSGPRVGVSVAADIPWRFWIAGDPFVSVYKRSPRAAPGFCTPDRESGRGSR